MSFPVRRAVAVALSTPCLWALGAGAASARPVESDRSDNAFTFTYDADEGDIETAASSIRWERGDPVTFILVVRDNPSSDEVGSRLRARLSLALNKNYPLRYQGTFAFTITNPTTGALVYEDASDARVILRPRRGERRDEIRFDLDLPSGEYEAKGFFEARD